MELINQNFVFCTQCGKKHETASKFCNSCGSALIKRDNTSSYIDNGYTEEEMKLFVSKNQEYYLRKFEKINRTGNKKSWNWSAFLFTLPWMIYRKMYLEAGLMYLISWILISIPVVGRVLRLVFAIVLVMFSNSLYLNHINRKFKKINSADSNIRQTLINEYGGTNVLGVIGILLVLLSIHKIINAIIMAIY